MARLHRTATTRPCGRTVVARCRPSRSHNICRNRYIQIADRIRNRNAWILANPLHSTTTNRP